jgi:hypothetical protein
MWRSLLIGYQYVLLVYFSLLNVLYALFSSIGLRAIVVVFAREFSQGSLRDLLERDVYKPVSILVPAHNEEVSIVGSVQSRCSTVRRSCGRPGCSSRTRR